ncbi:MAG: hydroxymethylbilane synthase [Kineosporiaceae bacterium]
MTTTTPTPARSGATTTLRLGTRRSALAVAQSRLMAADIEAAALLSGRRIRVDLVEVTTAGDLSRAPLSSLGGVGVFVSALREALLAGEVDLAVHSLKDLPTAAAPGLELAAVPLREDPRDALIARDGLGLADLPPGAVVGTGSPRRACQLLAARPDLKVVDIRGNVDTRLGMVADGQLDAVVLALSGLRRLGRDGAVTEVLDVSVMLPAPGQGALAVECREGDAGVLAALAPLEHPETRAAVLAERSLMSTLEAGCSAPLGGLAEVNGPDRSGGLVLRLRGLVGSPDGGTVLRGDVVAAAGEEPAEAGRRLAADLLADGAGTVLTARPPDVPGSGESGSGVSGSGRSGSGASRPDMPERPRTSQAGEGEL